MGAQVPALLRLLLLLLPCHLVPDQPDCRGVLGTPTGEKLLAHLSLQAPHGKPAATSRHEPALHTSTSTSPAAASPPDRRGVAALLQLRRPSAAMRQPQPCQQLLGLLQRPGCQAPATQLLQACLTQPRVGHLQQTDRRIVEDPYTAAQAESLSDVQAKYNHSKPRQDTATPPHPDTHQHTHQPHQPTLASSSAASLAGVAGTRASVSQSATQLPTTHSRTPTNPISPPWSAALQPR